MSTSPPAYFVFNTQIFDPSALSLYLNKVEDSYLPFGGKLLVQTQNAEDVEGDSTKDVVVILQFPSLKNARNWYQSSSYQEILPHRQKGSHTDGWLLPGIDPPFASEEHI